VTLTVRVDTFLCNTQSTGTKPWADFDSGDFRAAKFSGGTVNLSEANLSH